MSDHATPRPRKRELLLAMLLVAPLIALLQAPSPMAQAATCDLADVVDDTDPAVTYTGTWDTFADESNLCGSRVVGREAGATMTIPFSGSRAQVIGNTGNNLGIVQVELDGEIVATVNTYSSSRGTNRMHYDTGEIAAGAHTIKLTVTGERDPRSADIFVTIDALVTGSQLQLEHDADLPDDAFFDALDLDRPGLEAVKSAVEEGDFATATQALADYFTARTTPEGLFFNGEPPEPYEDFDRTAANQLVDGISYSRGNQQTPPRTGYMPYLTELAHAYWWTSDPRYAASLAGHLQRTAAEAGAINRTNALTAAQQAPNWIAAWQALRTAEEFTPDQRIDVLKGLLARGRWLDRNIVLEPGARTMNITWMIASGAAYLGIMFPEFKEADRWRDRGLAGMELSLDQDIYRDGAEKELATTYHGVYPQRLLGIGLLARKNGLDAGRFLLDRPEARRMVEYLIPMVKPDGSIPQLGDSDVFLTQQALGGGQVYLEQTGIPELEAIAAEDPEHHAVSGTPRRLLAVGAEVFHDPRMAFVASGGSEGVKPAPVSRGLRYAGQAFQRTGWELDDLYLAFDAGPYGRAHQHEDKLSIDLMAYGRTLATDPGRYTYTTSDPFRPYFMSTAAHSTVLVDGEGQRRSGLTDEYETEEPLADFGWYSDSVFDEATGLYDSGYGAERDTSVTHGREVFFAKQPGYWIVTDRLTAADDTTHTTETQFQFTPGDVQLAQDRPALTYVTQPEDGRPTAGLVVDAGSGDDPTVRVAEGEGDPADATCDLEDVVDNTDPAVTYTGRWSTFLDESDICGSRVTGREAGATMTIPFNGSRAQVLGNTGNNLGIVQVELDGEEVATVNTYSPSGEKYQVHYDTGEIADGAHTIKLTVTGEKDPSSSNIYVNVDALVMGRHLKLDDDWEPPVGDVVNEDPIRGWYSPRQGTKHAAPMAIFERSSALPRTDSTLLYPFAGAEAPTVRSSRVDVAAAEGVPLAAGTASAVRIERPGAEDLFLSSASPGTPVTFADARSDGRRAWLSYSTDGGTQSFVLVEGSTLIAPDGSVLVETRQPVDQLSGYVSGTVLHLEGENLPEQLRVTAPTAVSEVRVNGERVSFVRQDQVLQLQR